MVTVAEIFDHPWNKESAWNRPIGSNATLVQLAALTGLEGQGTINNDNKYRQALWLASNSDPQVTISKNPTLGSGSGLPVTLRMPGWEQFPGYSDNAGEGNALMNEGSFLSHDMYDLRRGPNASPADTAWYRNTVDGRGLGHGTTLGERTGSKASGLPGMAGVPRAAKWRAAQRHYHAFGLIMPRYPARHPPPLIINRKIQWPATVTDGNAGQVNLDSSPCPMGALLTFPHGFNYAGWVNGLALSSANKQRGIAMAADIFEYGCYIEDGGPPGFRADAPLYGVGGVTFAEWLEFRNNFVRKLWPQLRMVTNSVTGATATINASNQISGSIGGPGAAYTGTLRGTNMAFDAGDPGTPPPPPSEAAMPTGLISAAFGLEASGDPVDVPSDPKYVPLVITGTPVLPGDD